MIARLMILVLCLSITPAFGDDPDRANRTQADEETCYSSPTIDCLLTTMLQTPKGIDDKLNHTSALSTIARIQATSGNVTDALQTIREIDNALARVEVLSFIIEALAAKRQPR